MGGEVEKLLSKNIKTIRKQRELSQEEVAGKLNVVRQTVSKWEKGLSVPDAQLLIKLAKIFEVPVSILLGDEIESSTERNVLAEHLEELNAQLSQRNNSNKSTWKKIKIILSVIVTAIIILMILSVAS